MKTGHLTRSVHAAPFRRAWGAVLLVITAALAAAFVAGCGDGRGGAIAAFTQNVGTQQVFRIYEGVASTAVRFTDTVGQIHTRNYEIAVAIEVGPPLQSPATTLVERNPFHFRLNSAFPGTVAQEGLFTIVSAAVVLQGSTESLVQFWHFVDNNTSFSGELIQLEVQPQLRPESAPGSTGNVINLPSDPGGGFPIPIPFPLVRGTRITGTMTLDHLRFRVEGDTTDRRHPFVSEVTATRVR